MPPLSALREESDAKGAEQDRRGQGRPCPGIRRERSFAREGGGAAQSLRSFLARPPVTCGTGFLLEEGRVARRSARAFAPPPRQAEESRAGRGYVRPPLPARAAVGGEGVWEQGGYGGRQGLARSAPAFGSRSPLNGSRFPPRLLTVPSRCWGKLGPVPSVPDGATRGSSALSGFEGPAAPPAPVP